MCVCVCADCSLADVSSVDDLVYALTEEFPVWSKPSVGKDIRKVSLELSLKR